MVFMACYKNHFTTFLNLASFQNKVVEIRGKHEFGFRGKKYSDPWLPPNVRDGPLDRRAPSEVFPQ